MKYSKALPIVFFLCAGLFLTSFNFPERAPYSPDWLDQAGISHAGEAGAAVPMMEEISYPASPPLPMISDVPPAGQSSEAESTAAPHTQGVDSRAAFQLSGEAGFVYRLPKGYAALTFDDGPSQYTNQIVDILANYNVGGTFFFVGEHVDKYPAQVTYARDHGYSIAAHSMTHSDLTEVSPEQLTVELVHSKQLLEKVAGQPVTLFRPPYGAVNNNLLEALQKNEMKGILWNRDSKDWEKRDSDAILRFALESDASGTIFLFHELQETVDSLPKIIEHFQAQGVKLVSLK